jgi:hypothetical protein
VTRPRLKFQLDSVANHVLNASSYDTFPTLNVCNSGVHPSGKNINARFPATSESTMLDDFPCRPRLHEVPCIAMVLRFSFVRFARVKFRDYGFREVLGNGDDEWCNPYLHFPSSRLL